jgi:hypothetical protein
MRPEQDITPQQYDALLLATHVCQETSKLRSAELAQHHAPALKEAFRRTIQNLSLNDDQLMDLWSYFLLASYAAKEEYLARFPNEGK